MKAKLAGHCIGNILRLVERIKVYLEQLYATDSQVPRVRFYFCVGSQNRGTLCPIPISTQAYGFALYDTDSGRVDKESCEIKLYRATEESNGYLRIPKEHLAMSIAGSVVANVPHNNAILHAVLLVVAETCG